MNQAQKLLYLRYKPLCSVNIFSMLVYEGRREEKGKEGVS